MKLLKIKIRLKRPCRFKRIFINGIRFGLLTGVPAVFRLKKASFANGSIRGCLPTAVEMKSEANAKKARRKIAAPLLVEISVCEVIDRRRAVEVKGLADVDELSVLL